MAKRSELSLVGKILSDQSQSLEDVKDTMKAAWRPNKRMDAEKIGQNLFLFQFSDQTNRRSVLQGRPWLLGKLLVVVQNFKINKKLAHIKFNRSPFWVRVRNLLLNRIEINTARMIRNRIGEFMDVDLDFEEYTNCCVPNLLAMKAVCSGLCIWLGGVVPDLCAEIYFANSSPLKFSTVIPHVLNCKLVLFISPINA
ncbi:hypothetical protein LguiB_035839 [Lonicera macranthoides]